MYFLSPGPIAGLGAIVPAPLYILKPGVKALLLLLSRLTKQKGYVNIRFRVKAIVHIYTYTSTFKGDEYTECAGYSGSCLSAEKVPGKKALRYFRPEHLCTVQLGRSHAPFRE